MFIAKDIDGNNVTIEEAELFEKENPGIKREYFCPSCKNQVFVKAPKSDKVRTHFAHTKKCSDDWKYDMSEWHRNWQNCFPKECQEVVMSNGVEIHRADVCINNTVIEFQHSSITAEEVKKRNDFYTQAGYNIIWIFDVDKKIKDNNGTLIDENYVIYKLNTGDKFFEWKKANHTFENFKMLKNMNVYFETQCGNSKILFLVEPDYKYFKRYIYRYLFVRENFLKQVGIIDSNEIPSIDDIINHTNQIRKQLRR